MSTPVGDGERVILLDEEGNAAGTALKSEVHHRDTPLHLAFSCYVFDDQDRLLLTQRALSKRTWPGAWTNTCCGHPGPGEPITDAVRRRVREELGIEVDDVRVALPAFRYREVMPDGTVENEMCPVFVARMRHSPGPSPDPAEVADSEWVDWLDLRRDVSSGRREVSPWCQQQLEAMPANPWDTSPPPGSLPAAAEPRSHPRSA